MSINNNYAQELLEQLTEKDILDIMEKFGASPLKVKNNEIWFRTICHGGDSSKLCYFRDSKDFYCYTNCGKLSIYDLIMQIRNCSFGDSMKFLKQSCGRNFTEKRRYGINRESNLEEEIAIVSEQVRYNNLLNKEFNPTPIPAIKDENIMKCFEDIYYTGWINEGISMDSMKKYNIKWYEIANHIIIPHYDIEGNLVGIRRRTLDEFEALRNKYMPESIQVREKTTTYAHPLGLNLYGLEHTKEAIQRKKKIILVEAEKSVLLSDSYYGDDSIAVATCGFNISGWQKNMIIRLKPEEVIIAYDKDYDPLEFKGQVITDEKKYQGFLKYKEKLKSLADTFSCYCKVSLIIDNLNLLDIKDSPFDKGKEKFNTLMNNRIIL